MRIQRILGELCIFKHRLSASKNESRAAEHIYNLMRSLGLVANIDEFKSQKRMTWELTAIFSFFIIGSALYFINSTVSAILMIIGAILFWGYFTTKFKPLAPLFRFSKSQNVVGRLQNPDAPYKIVLTAHYDTARSGPMWDPKRVSSFRLNFMIGFFVILLLGILSISHLFLPHFRVIDILILLGGLYILIQTVVLIYSGITGKPVEGASDNASGVAVMLDLAARLKEYQDPQIEYWFVATGSEEVGAIGMENFLKTYDDEILKDNAYFINFDNIGSGNLHYYLGEGMLNLYRFSKDLIRAAEIAANTKPFNSVTPDKYRLAYTDAIVPASRGYQAILILATDEKGHIKNWHWPTDTINNIDYSVPVLASDFGLKLIQNLTLIIEQHLSQNNEDVKKLQEDLADSEDI